MRFQMGAERGEGRRTRVDKEYCDCKIYAFNDMIFNLGWKHARYTRAWFSIGVYFSLVALVGISLLLLWDSLGAFHVRGGSVSAWLPNLLDSSFSVSITDTPIIIASTILSIAFHEFGHAIAAARSISHLLVHLLIL
ncbi:hypothetical protein ACQ4PT_035819 [Festuca glaucescens]